MNTTKDYRLAPSGDGPLANTYADKPHRLVYDLANAVDNLKQLVKQGADELERLRDVHLPQYEDKMGEPDAEVLAALRAGEDELNVNTSDQWAEYLDQQYRHVQRDESVDESVDIDNFLKQSAGAAAGMKRLVAEWEAQGLKPDGPGVMSDSYSVDANNLVMSEHATLAYHGKLATPEDRARMVLGFLFPEQLDRLLKAAGIEPHAEHAQKVEQLSAAATGLKSLAPSVLGQRLWGPGAMPAKGVMIDLVPLPPDAAVIDTIKDSKPTDAVDVVLAMPDEHLVLLLNHAGIVPHATRDGKINQLLEALS